MNDNGNDGVSFDESGETGGQTVDMGSWDENAGFEVLPVGKYPCTVSSLEYGQSQNSGNNMWSWQLEVESGEHAGSRLFYHTVFQGKPQALARTKKSIKAVFPDLASRPFDPEAFADSGEWAGARCTADVNIRPYQGEKRNNVKDLLPAAEGGGSFLG